MTEIATLTMNPAIDAGYDVERVTHTRKLRASSASYDPGGGGINVARVLVRLGASARCYYLSGGATGVAFDGLLNLHQLVTERIPIADQTRISTTLRESTSGLEYRVVPPGPVVTEPEWRECLDRLGKIRGDVLVISGSLPEGVPSDFYAQAVRSLQGRGIRIFLDSSGRGLAGAIEDGGIFLIKPSLDELQELVGKALPKPEDIVAAAHSIVHTGGAEHVAVSLGAEGAILVSGTSHLRLPAVPVDTCSAVGAGDSFLAAMVFRLSQGDEMEQAFRFGLAAGAAAVTTPGTDLARAEDIWRLYNEAVPRT